jgi:hypothetical protein
LCQGAYRWRQNSTGGDESKELAPIRLHVSPRTMVRRETIRCARSRHPCELPETQVATMSMFSG